MTLVGMSHTETLEIDILFKELHLDYSIKVISY